jgi:predicted aconitase
MTKHITLNLTYTEHINNLKLVNVSNKQYEKIEENIEVDNGDMINIYYRITTSKNYILYLYVGNPYASYIEVSSRGIFKGNTITLKDIVNVFMKRPIIIRHYTDDDIQIKITSDDTYINGSEFILNHYNTYKDDSDSD